MLQTTNDEALNTQATENKKNQNILSDTSRVNSGGIGRSIENLLIIVKSAKSK